MIPGHGSDAYSPGLPSPENMAARRANNTEFQKKLAVLSGAAGPLRPSVAICRVEHYGRGSVS